MCRFTFSDLFHSVVHTREPAGFYQFIYAHLMPTDAHAIKFIYFKQIHFSYYVYKLAHNRATKFINQCTTVVYVCMHNMGILIILTNIEWNLSIS